MTRRKEGVAPNCSVFGRTEPAGDGVCQEANEYWFASHVFRVDGMYIESLARRVRNIIEREKGDRK